MLTDLGQFCYWSGRGRAEVDSTKCVLLLVGQAHLTGWSFATGRAEVDFTVCFATGRASSLDWVEFCYRSGRGRLHQVCFATGRASSLDWVEFCYWSGRGRLHRVFCYWSGKLT